MPDVVAHYRILEKLGAGGMGDVYLAQDTRLNRKVAIKFIQPGSAPDDQANRRLLREARAAAMLDHPNICAIHEVGEEAGRSFIVMQYLEGDTLDRRLRRQRLSLSETLNIAVEVADALSDAHVHGIIHRDIKPSNIMVTTRGQAKVMDFGLASMEAGANRAESETQSLLTAPDTVIGTVPYMSPEQLTGDQVDPRTDIFSFGVMLYEMVCGQRPFARDTKAATVSAILTQDPPPLMRDGPEVPAELQRIVRKCLEKDRDRRYQSAADLTLDLESLKGRLVSDKGEPPSAGARVVHHGSRLTFMLAAAVLGVTLAGGWYAVRQFHDRGVPVNTIGSIAVFPFVNSSGDQSTEYLSDGITESLINNFSQLPKLRVMARTTMFRYKGRDVDPLAAGRELGVDAALSGRVFRQGQTLVVQADLVRVGDGSQLWGDRFDRKLADVLAIQDEIARQIADRLRWRLTGDEQELITKRYTKSTEAYDLYLKGRYFFEKLTEADLDKSIVYYQQAIAIDPDYALAYAGLANSYARLGGVFGFRSPGETLPRGLEHAVKALSLDPKLADAHTTLASYKMNYEWNWAEAEQGIKRALDLNPNDGMAHQAYGTYFNMQGRLEEAIAERRIGQQLDPLSPLATANAGYPYYYAHRYDEAIVHFRRALELDPNYSWAHLWIGQAYVQKGMYPEAIEAIQRALQLSGRDTRALATLGHAYGVAGRRDDALKILDELRARSEQKYVSPYFMALIHLGMKSDDQAFAALDAAFKERHPYLIFLKVEPVFDRVRSDPRFVALEKRVGLTI